MNPLSPLGWIYGFVADARNWLYDREIFRSESLGALTVSIGNLTVGGTGKTPLVAYVAKVLSDNGRLVCVLTRGYGRKNAGQQVLVSDGRRVLCDARTGGDEPVELAYKLLGKAAVIANRDRVTTAEWARENLGATAFVLDDAFQHRRAKRDVDIVCIDATNPFGNGESLPAGILREHLSNVSRADAVVITRCDLVKDTDAVEDKLRRVATNVKVFRSSNKIVRFTQLKDLVDGDAATANGEELRGSEGFAFCGLGNPLNFFRQLEKEGLQLTGRKTYSDHHFYNARDIAEIERRARAAGSSFLVTTVKDAVRLLQMEFRIPCYVAEIETVMADAEAFRDLIVS